MNRIDLYATVHKGVRAALVNAATLAARTDFAEAVEASVAAEAARFLVRHLEAHAAHEDREVLPALARVAPELHADLQADHARTDGLAHEVLATADRVEACPATERPSVGRRLHDQLWQLTAEHIRHMEREETQAMRALWAHYTDEELLAIHQRIVASIPPAALAEWGTVLLPALSLPERTAVLGPLVRSLPRQALETVVGPVRQALGDQWRQTAATIGL